jgi:N-succinyldiaminopimelate aminotransferase
MRRVELATDGTIMAERLRGFFGATIFSEMTALAQSTGALNLGQGFPDSDGPATLLEAARAAISASCNQYPPAIGVSALRAEIANRRLADHGVEYDPNTEIVVTTGATEALAAAIIAVCDPGDEVIVFDPLYDSYAASIAIAGARVRPVLLEYDGNRFTFDPEALRAAVGPRARMLLLNTPHNPTGKVFNADELAEIADVCQRHNLIAVTDEVYEYLLFDGARHLALAGLPGMAQRTLTISSAGKTFSVTGWKVGWACGPAALVAAMRTVKQYLTFGSGTPLQEAVAHGLREGMGWVAEMRDSLQHRRDLVIDGLRAAGITTFTTEGTYFAQFDARSLGYDDGVALCRVLAERAGVAAIPSVALYDDKQAGRHLVRLAFCKSERMLTEAVDRLTAFAAKSQANAVSATSVSSSSG